ncbi:VCBS repeat-containing protein [bacterium]|nr:VCBS repeat-containing protein [bacterium]
MKLRTQIHSIFLILSLLLSTQGLFAGNEDGVVIEKFSLTPPGNEISGFTLLDNQTLQVGFENKLSQSAWLNNQNLLNGSGAAIGDYDGDGLCDIYLCSLSGKNRLYKNLGEWKFMETTNGNLACDGVYSTGTGFADLNGDGWLDLLVLAMGSPNRIFFNNGRGDFDKPRHLPGNNWQLSGSTSFAIGDIDGDSDPDLYVTNYGFKSILKDGGAITINKINGRDTVTGRYANKIRIIDGELHEFGEEDDILINDGNGNFQVKKWGSLVVGGINGGFPYRDQGLCVAFRDLNGDMAPEIVVANDGHPDRFFVNDGRGLFETYSSHQIRHLSYNSMGLDFADVNRDSVDDLVVVEMLATGRIMKITQDKNSFPKEEFIANRNPDRRPQSGRNMLYLGRGDMTFSEVAYMMGLAASDWSWSSVFLDVDLDGFEDLLVTNGFQYDTDDWDTQTRLMRLNMNPLQRRKSALLYPKLDTPNQAFRNVAGKSFVAMGREWGFDSMTGGYGMACGDLDNDGDLDLVVNNINSGVSIYRNDCFSPRLAIQLKGYGGNTSGTGARLIVEGHEVTQSQEMISGGRYMSSDQAIRVFAAKEDTSHSVTVRWRSGQVSRLKQLESGYRYLISHPPGPPSVPPVVRPVSKAGIFRQTRVEHDRNWSIPIAEQLQPGLPFDVRRMDPSVLVMDIDGESGLDLLISEGEKGISVFLADDNGSFNPGPQYSWPTAGLVAGGLDLKGYVLALTRPPRLLKWSGEDLVTAQELQYPGDPRSAVFLDYDSDGDSDLFVGGGSLPGRYPLSSRSALFENRSGTFVMLQSQLEIFSHLSLVTDVASGDMNGDGAEDLVVAQEWGSIGVFLNRAGVFEDSTKVMGLSQYSGLWQCAHLADVNGDGRKDIIAGNFGNNTVYATYPLPVRLSYLDLQGQETVGALEFHYDKDLGDWFPTRKYNVATSAFPTMRHRIPTSRRYASMSMEQILGDQFQISKHREINFLNSVIFFNEGGTFSVQVLPDKIQASPVFGVCSGDFNGDNNDDLFIAQNFFGVPEKFSRYDSGQGSIILGVKGGLSTVLETESSGIRLLGEQRSPVSVDFNGDGQLDIVLAERGSGVVLLENSSLK